MTLIYSISELFVSFGSSLGSEKCELLSWPTLPHTNHSEKTRRFLDVTIMPHSQPTSPRTDALHILLVDDDEFLLDLMKETLLDLGAASVVLAKNGIEGLKVFKQSNAKPNLIICDLCMPQLGGMELLGHLAREGCQAEVLIMSGHNLTPPKDQHWNLSNYDGPVLNLAEKLARIQGIKVRATFEKPITRVKVVEMLKTVGFQGSE